MARPIGHDALVIMMKEAGVRVIDNTPPAPFNAKAMFDMFDAKCARKRLTLTEGRIQAGMRSQSTITRLSRDEAVDGNNIALAMMWLGITDFAPFMRQR